MNMWVSLELSDREEFSGTKGEDLVLIFLFPCMFYTFQLLPQFKIGRSEPDKADFFSQIA